MKENKKRFKLSKVNWVFALAVIGVSAFVFLRNDGINSFSLGYLFGSIVISGLIPLLFAFVVWLIRRRKAYAGTYTFNVVLVLMCFGMIQEIGAIRKEKIKNANVITNSAAEFKEKIINEEDAILAYETHSTNIEDGLSKMIKNSTGNEQEVYINLKKFTSINSSVMIAWQKSYDLVMEPRILDYSVLRDQAEFNYQIGVLKQYQKQSELYKSHFEKRMSLIEDFNKNIPKENKALKGVMKGISKKDSIQKPIFKTFINSHINYGNSLIEMVEFLKNNNEEWKYQNDELIFNSSELEKRYSDIIKQIAEVEVRINESTEKLIGTM